MLSEFRPGSLISVTPGSESPELLSACKAKWWPEVNRRPHSCGVSRKDRSKSSCLVHRYTVSFCCRLLTEYWLTFSTIIWRSGIFGRSRRWIVLCASISGVCHEVTHMCSQMTLMADVPAVFDTWGNRIGLSVFLCFNQVHMLSYALSGTYF